MKTNDLGRETYEKGRYGCPPTRLGILLAQGDQPFRKPLSLLGLGPCCCDRLVCEQRRNQVSEESLSMSRVTTEVTVLIPVANHDCCV